MYKIIKGINWCKEKKLKHNVLESSRDKLQKKKKIYRVFRLRNSR